MLVVGTCYNIAILFFLSTNVGDYGGLCECPAPAPGQQCRQLTEVSNQHRTISHYPWVLYVVTAELFTRSDR